MARKDKQRDESEGAEAESASRARRAWEQISPIAAAVIIALGIRAMVIESYYVPSGSMLPSMWIGDHVFVSKFSFGARVPLTGWTLPALRDPERGEIVVFALGRGPGGVLCPLDQCPDYSSEGFVKRIVGIPGDTVEVRGGQLYLNGELAPVADTGEQFVDDYDTDMDVLTESLPQCSHQLLDNPHHPGWSSGPKTVEEDRYFLMGDNRDNSKDSRVSAPCTAAISRVRC